MLAQLSPVLREHGPRCQASTLSSLPPAAFEPLPPCPICKVPDPWVPRLHLVRAGEPERHGSTGAQRCNLHASATAGAKPTSFISYGIAKRVAKKAWWHQRLPRMPPAPPPCCRC